MKASYLLRLPNEKLRSLKKQAKAQDLSLNQFISNKLDETANPDLAKSSKLELKNIILESPLGESVLAVLAFGSVIKQTSTELSDYDLLIVLSEDVKITRSLYSLWDRAIAPKITKEMSKGREISPHFVNIKDSLADIHSLWLEVAISGKIIWSKNDRVENLLYKIRNAIAHSAFVRKITHGQGYWIRNNSNL